MIAVFTEHRPYVENYTVDASILDTGCIAGITNMVEKKFLNFSHNTHGDQVSKCKRWMPWHLEPKKDVGICDKPRGVDNRTLIRGFPNGETPLGMTQ